MSESHSPQIDPESSWRQLKLSIERPYKDDSGNYIPILHDLTSEGERIYEAKETPASRIETNLRRIFLERGSDFFERKDALSLRNELPKAQNPHTEGDLNPVGEKDDVPKAMTIEELYAMRSELIPHLYVALGEMSHARDLLNSVLSGIPHPQPRLDAVPSLLSATLVSKPPSIISVQAFNSQLAIGSKDEALRKAAQLFRSEADIMERNRVKGEQYFTDALKIRRANWGLSPAPLPLGLGTVKDKTAKDFMISYGLETSPAFFRRRAVAHLPSEETSEQNLISPFHQNTRLRISISSSTQFWSESSSFASFKFPSNSTNVETILKHLQTEVIDQEIFSLLVKEAGNLPTASARVSERLIVVDVAQGLDLSFELVESSANTETNRPDSQSGENFCELIYHVLRVLLLRKHDLVRQQKFSGSHSKLETVFMLLQPIIDMLQYRIFCERIEVEFHKATKAIDAAGIPSKLTFTEIGERGELLLSMLSEQGRKTVGGEAVIKIGDWHTLWFTFASPSTLTAQLSQATLTIASLPQLSQLLMDEIERCLLIRISRIGRQITGTSGAIWFIDLNRCVAKWEGCMLNFQMSFGVNMRLDCLASVVNDKTGPKGLTFKFLESPQGPLFTWVQKFIQESYQKP